MKLLDSISAPGSALGGGMKPGAGDDRYVFDEEAGVACVIDGATDVGAVRLFPDAESDAARFAEIFAHELLANPPAETESPQAYFLRFLLRLREASAMRARHLLEDAPRSSLPTAAATWLRARDGALESATLGDTLAIVLSNDGTISIAGDAGKPADESARARKIMTLTAAKRHEWLQDLRAIHNTEAGYWIFGVEPEAASHIVHQTLPCPPGTRALLMSDGFYRLVSPYGRHDDAQLIDLAMAQGLGALMTELRSMEADPAEDVRIGRFKTSDDATALLLEF
ncbi:MAG: protein phosphatase 2C domain-containing protein [Alphaproteobacteria bacterium]|nr:protein phosphatase 2C domain-containing protein [Alphaproteobacteria bacterium]